MIPTKILITNILETKKITLRRLASIIKITPMMMTRILSSDDEICSLKTYIRLKEFQEKILREEHDVAA